MSETDNKQNINSSLEDVCMEVLNEGWLARRAAGATAAVQKLKNIPTNIASKAAEVGAKVADAYTGDTTTGDKIRSSAQEKKEEAEGKVDKSRRASIYNSVQKDLQYLYDSETDPKSKSEISRARATLKRTLKV